jgi:hypothetical protein
MHLEVFTTKMEPELDMQQPNKQEINRDYILINYSLWSEISVDDLVQILY